MLVETPAAQALQGLWGSEGTCPPVRPWSMVVSSAVLGLRSLALLAPATEHHMLADVVDGIPRAGA